MRDQARRPVEARIGHRRLITVVALAILLIGVGVLIVWTHGGDQVASSDATVPGTPASQAQTSEQILDSTRALGITQQQAVDQLQVVQDLLVAQQIEMKRLAEQVAAMSSKIELLQQAETTAPAPVPTPKLTSNSRR